MIKYVELKSTIKKNSQQVMYFLGIGHSARDTYELLYSKGISMEAKPFAIGVRIEHPQDLIDKAQYGEDYKSELLPVADYSLTYNNRQKR